MSEDETPRKKAVFPASPGMAVIGLFATGIAGILVGLIASSGTALIAAALAFGTVAWVAFR